MAAMTFRVADLLLRGTTGPVRARVDWPDEPVAEAPLVVLLHGAGCAREHCLAAGSVVLSPYTAAWADAVETLEWAADHGAELGAGTNGLAVAGARRHALAERLRRAGVDVDELHIVRNPREEGTMTIALTPMTIVRWIDAPPERVFDGWAARDMPFRVLIRPSRIVVATADPDDPEAPLATIRLQPVGSGTKLHLHASVPEHAEADWAELVESL
jgi:hypothetical protein